MYESWLPGTTTLLAVFEAAQGNGAVERSRIDRRSGCVSPGWPGMLTRLSSVEAAMLQDLAWWGPQMEGRLTQLTDVRTTA